MLFQFSQAKFSFDTPARTGPRRIHQFVCPTSGASWPSWMWIDGSILLNPSVNIATPRGWASVRPDALPRSKRYSEVHLVGGGTLLMWLLVKAKCAPFATRIICHGPMVRPTPESCQQWLGDEARRRGIDDDVDIYEWRRQAVGLGVGGNLRTMGKEWLEPLLKEVAMGRCHVLAEDFDALRVRWERSGRLTYRPLEPSRELTLGSHILGTQLLRSTDDVRATEQAVARPSLVQCAEDECDLLVQPGKPFLVPRAPTAVPRDR